MTRLVNVLLVVVLFALGFVGVAWYHAAAQGRPLAALLVPTVECDASAEPCRKRLRAQAELYFAAGDFTSGDTVYRRMAQAGDVQSAFQLGWHHEEAWRAAVGSRLETGTRLREESEFGAQGLPQGPAFDALIARHMVAETGTARVEHERALAFLWYGRAVQAGFAPAMNNLGAMYQFGILGSRDDGRAKDWYKRAAALGNPVAAANFDVVRAREAGQGMHDCGPAVEWPIFRYVTVDRPEIAFDALLGHTRIRGRAPTPAMMRFFRDPADFAAKVQGDAGPLPHGVYSDPPVELVIAGIADGKVAFDDVDPNAAPTPPRRFVDCSFKPGPGVKWP